MKAAEEPIRSYRLITLGLPNQAVEASLNRALLPVLGVAYLYPAVRRFRWARRRKVEWNPARGYLAAGLALASGGWLVTLVSWLFVFNALADAGSSLADSPLPAAADICHLHVEAESGWALGAAAVREGQGFYRR